MSQSREPIGARIEGGPHQPGRPGAAEWLCLAATPSFAIMALRSCLELFDPTLTTTALYRSSLDWFGTCS